MATIRKTILEALRTRLATLPDWDVTRRRDVDKRGSAKVRATVWMLGEENQFAGSDAYDVTLTAAVEIEANAVDADDDEDGDGTPGSANPYDYLDRRVAEAEGLIHTPDSWGLDPAFTDVTVNGHDVADPEAGESFDTVAALLRLTFRYRRSIQDPSR